MVSHLLLEPWVWLMAIVIVFVCLWLYLQRCSSMGTAAQEKDGSKQGPLPAPNTDRLCEDPHAPRRRQLSQQNSTSSQDDSWWTCCACVARPRPGRGDILSTSAGTETTHVIEDVLGDPGECTCRTCSLGAKLQLDIESSVKATQGTTPVNGPSLLTDIRNIFQDGSADWVDDGTVARMIIATGGDIELAHMKLQQAVRWRANCLLGWHRDLELHPHAPELYRQDAVIGIGRHGRPMLHLASTFQRWGDPPAAQQAACAIDEALARAGPKAKFDFLLDLFGFQYSLNLNIMPFLKLARALDSYFAERVHRVVIIDMPGTAEWIWNACKPLLAPKTVLKFVFARFGDPASMESALFDLCRGASMRAHVEAILAHNRHDCDKVAHYKRDRVRFAELFRAMVREYRQQHD